MIAAMMSSYGSHTNKLKFKIFLHTPVRFQDYTEIFVFLMEGNLNKKQAESKKEPILPLMSVKPEKQPNSLFFCLFIRVLSFFYFPFCFCFFFWLKDKEKEHDNKKKHSKSINRKRVKPPRPP